MSIWRGPNCIAGVSDTQKEGITKESVGLGNVDNTSDKDKPISEAVQKALDELKNSVSDGKTAVANAITGKGVTTATDATFDTMSNNITQMGTNQYNSGYSTGKGDGYSEGNSVGYTTGYNAGVSATKKGTAVAADVLSGKTFTNSSGVNISGSMPNNGAVSKSITPSTSAQSYTIPAGYHNGNGKVNVAAAPTSLIDGDAGVADVLSGKTFFVDSYTKKTGSMANQGAKTASLNCGGSYTIPAGYHNGSGKVTANSLASQTSATATASDIASGKTAYVNGVKVTGTAIVIPP